MTKVYDKIILWVLMAVAGCTAPQHRSLNFKDSEGYNHADSVVSDIGDERDFARLLVVVDSFERAGELTPVRAIFYKTIAYNIMGQQQHALNLYYKLAAVDVKALESQADLESYIYSYKDYVRLLCNMRSYDRVLREAYHADRKLKEAGYDSFVDHQDIAQMIGECQLYLNQAPQAAEHFAKSLQTMRKRLVTNHDPLDLLECQKTMNAIARGYIHTGRYDEATPWIARQDSLFAAADNHPQRDSVYVDEMKAEINYSKALLAHVQGREAEAERAFADYQSTELANQLGSVINANEYLMLTHRYEEAAQRYTQLERFLKESGYQVDLETFGRYLMPKFRANMLAGHRDSALQVAIQVAEVYDSALARQKMSDADLLTTIYDTEGKERQIAEQRAELSQQRLFTVAIVTVILIIFFLIYTIQRRKAYRALNATNRQLMLANERAEESSRMKTEFIQKISHEVRTPLNLLSGYSQVLGNMDIEIDEEELQDICGKIVQNSERITSMVDKFIDMSMIYSNTGIECLDTVSPAAVAEQAVEMSEIRKTAHLDFEIRVSPEAEALHFVVNQKMAVKALYLLLDNAIKFTHPLVLEGRKDRRSKAHVTLRIGSDSDQVTFVVEDTGIGVPSEQAEHIFDEFVQLNKYSEGTGIGLSIARSLVRRMNGEITLDTIYTDGARFVMSLPLARVN
ncbi:MAG: HAMP domain-containing histidine kinase [Prevotella sp.]|nr:HAMP domain-containing histidine kinase [Prevotella sp.]